MAKNQVINKFNDLFLISTNIQNIYQELVLAELLHNKLQRAKMFDYLEMAKEQEDAIYQSLSSEEITQIKKMIPILPKVNLVSETQQINELEKPFFRMFQELDKLEFQMSQNQSDETDLYNLLLGKSEVDSIVEEVQTTYDIMNIKLLLIYLNLFKRKKGTSTKEYYDIIYLDRYLETLWLPSKFSPLRLDEIDLFLQSRCGEVNSDYEFDFSKLLTQRFLADIPTFLTNSNKPMTTSQYLYYISIYFTVPADLKTELLEELDKLVKNYQLASKNPNLIDYLLHGIYTIEKKKEKKSKLQRLLKDATNE